MRETPPGRVPADAPFTDADFAWIRREFKIRADEDWRVEIGIIAARDAKFARIQRALEANYSSRRLERLKETFREMLARESGRAA
jgi:hypothetical protein